MTKLRIGNQHCRGLPAYPVCAGGSDAYTHGQARPAGCGARRLTGQVRPDTIRAISRR